MILKVFPSSHVMSEQSTANVNPNIEPFLRNGSLGDRRYTTLSDNSVGRLGSDPNKVSCKGFP